MAFDPTSATYAELRSQCKSLGLPSTGTKAVLIKRLQDAASSSPVSDTASVASSVASSVARRRRRGARSSTGTAGSNNNSDDAASNASSRASTGPVDFASMRVPELRTLLEERGLDSSGRKSDLVARLENASPSASASSPSPSLVGGSHGTPKKSMRSPAGAGVASAAYDISDTASTQQRVDHALHVMQSEELESNVLEAVNNLRRKQLAAREELTFLRSPLRMVVGSFWVILQWIKDLLLWFSANANYIVVLFFPFVTASIVWHDTFLPFFDDLMDELEWIILGIASSVGLGSGVHTFLLYLGPWIAQVTTVAYECGTHELLKGTDHATNPFVCPDEILALGKNKSAEMVAGVINPATGAAFEPTTVMGVFTLVGLPALLWGIGTAIGELPPYFFARKSKLAGESLDEINELLDSKADSAVDRWKAWLINNIDRMGFFGILAFASVPNPLFDLAGLACGFALVPFWTFFGATAIGKGVFKACAFQATFYIMVFGNQYKNIVGAIENTVPALAAPVKAWRERLVQQMVNKVAPEPTLVSIMFGHLITLIIAITLMGILEMSVQKWAADHDEEAVAQYRLELENARYANK